MTQILWDQVGEKSFEKGCDRGVLYLTDGSGVAWNGLTSVTEKFGGTTTPLYFEGVKYNEIVTMSEFAASLKAFTYPDEFMDFEGIQEAEPGFYITDQTPKRFGLSYRVGIGNDIDVDAGYKLHILCNLLAIPNQKNYATLSDSPSAIEFEWNITAIPVAIPGFRPTAHIIVDSTKVNSDILEEIEAMLYGTDVVDSRLPPFPELMSVLNFEPV